MPVTYSKLSRKELAIFLLVFFCYAAFFLFVYWDGEVIDFGPLYVVGKMFLQGEWESFYDFKIVQHPTSFTFKTGDRFLFYSEQIGYSTEENPIPLYFYSPSLVPFFALFALFPYESLEKIVIVMNCFAFVFALLTIARITFSEKDRMTVFVIFSIALLYTDPVDWLVKTGQVTPWLFLLTLFAWKWAEEESPTRAGISLGIAFWLKFFPALLSLYWLRYRKYRAVGVFVVTVIVLFLFGFVLFGKSVFKDYLMILQAFGLGTPVFPMNQSLESVLMRWWLPVQATVTVDNVYLYEGVKVLALIMKAAILIVLSLMLLQPANDFGRRLQGFCTIAVCSSLLSISWNHYVIFSLPLIVCLFSHYRGRYKDNPSSIGRLIVMAILFVFMFLHVSIVRFITNSTISIAGRAAGELCVRFLFSRELIGVLTFFLIGAILFFKKGRAAEEIAHSSRQG